MELILDQNVHPFGGSIPALPYAAFGLLFTCVFYNVFRRQGAGRELDLESQRTLDTGAHGVFVLAFGLLALMTSRVTALGLLAGALVTLAFWVTARQGVESLSRASRALVVFAWLCAIYRIYHPVFLIYYSCG
jgi:hypothetical protein